MNQLLNQLKVTLKKEIFILNFETNKIFWKKGKIRKLLFGINEETFPKDESFLNYINLITIKLNDKNVDKDESFCV